MFVTSVGIWETDNQNINVKYTPELINGIFTVNDSGKKVKFTKGNLYWNGSAFRCEAKQYDYPTAWNENHVGHFFWSKDAEIAIAESYSDNSKTTEDTFFAADGGAIEGYTVLSEDEWQYLIDNSLHATMCETVKMYNDDNDHCMFYYTGTYEQAKAAFDANTAVRAQYEGKSFDELYGDIITAWETKSRNIAGVGCVILKPDGFEGEIKESYTASEWAEAEAAYGLVALPFTGSRGGAVIYGTGHYSICWSSSPNADDADHAWYVDFGAGQADMIYLNRDSGYSVRLVSVQ